MDNGRNSLKLKEAVQKLINTSAAEEKSDSLLEGRTDHSFLIPREEFHTGNMGSSLSRGRKLSPHKNGSNSNSTDLPEHEKFTTKKDEDFVEGVVCKEDEIRENEMKVVNLHREEFKVLLYKQKGQIYATGTKCTHYGAPLVQGYLGKGRVRCPWHGACFNISNGDIEDFPGLDSLPCYEVKLSEGNVIVRASTKLLQTNKRVTPFIRTVQPQKETFLVVGGGPAGAVCVETLRSQGFEGRIIFIMAENYLPYDRVKLTKSTSTDFRSLTLRPMDFYLERNIEIKMKTKVTNLSLSNSEVLLDSGESLTYDKVFLATGASSRRLEVPGSELKNIFVLRTIEDAQNVNRVISQNTRLVIVGTSFIGMEAASLYVGKVKSLVVVGREVPFKKSLGEEIGNVILKLFEEKNIQFHLSRTVTMFEGKKDKLEAVHLSNGLKLPADVCILGVGSIPNTSFLDSSGILVTKTGQIEVNEFLQTNSRCIFAGGDIVRAPVLGQKASIGHWGLASYHGQVAAFNMLGRKKPLRAVPFFWTVLFGKGFRYAGYARTYDEVVIDGSIEGSKFIGFYCSGGDVVAVITLNRDPLAAKFAEMLHEGQKLKKKEISNWLKV